MSRRTTAAALVALLAPALPARAVLTVDSSFASVESFAAFDANGDGAFAPGDLLAPDPIVGTAGSFSESSTAELGGARGSAVQDTTVSAGASSLSVTSSGACESASPVAVDPDETIRRGATSQSGFAISFTLTERATFSLAGSVAVNPPIGREGGGSNRAKILSGGLDVDIEADDAFLDPQSDSTTASGELEPGSYDVFVRCETAAPRARDFLPVGNARWRLSLTVSEVETGDVFRWVGPAVGAFGDDANWDPEGAATAGVPTFVAGERSDTALFRGGRAEVDVAALAGIAAAPRSARGAGTCAGPIARTIGRLVLDSVREVELVNGALALDALSLEDRALTIEDNGLLELRTATLCARHADIGARGRPSAALVTGPGGVLETLGSLAVGRYGDGTLRILDGGIASSEEVLLGDGEKKGTAVVSDATWQTGSIAVGFRSSGDLTVENGGLVESELAFVDRELAPGSGDTARATVRGAGSLWRVDDLFVGGRGTVEVDDGGRLETAADLPNGTVFVGVPGSGEATFLVNEGGELDVGASLDVGVFGSGRLVVAEAFDRNPRVDVATALRIGTDPNARGRVQLVGDPATDGFSVVSDTLEVGGPPSSRGELVVDLGGRILTSTDASVGTGGGEGRVVILGAAPADLTRWQISRSLAIGGAAAPALGTLVIRDATVDVGTPSTAGSVLVRPGGAIVGGGAQSVLRIHGGLLTNDGAIFGPLTVDGRYDAASTGILVSALAAPPASPRTLAARSPAGAIAAVGAPRRKPPLPAQGPIAFTGDAELGGTLVLQFGNGFAPRQGDAFALIEAGEDVIGDFADVVIRGLAPGAEFEETVRDGALTLTSLTDTIALPAVSLAAKPKLKEKSRKGAATFKRTGDVAEPLTVAFRVGGTAARGVDYVDFPDAITIPAGKRSAKLPIRPIRDGSAEPDETIEIEILPQDDYAPGLSAKVAISLVSAE
jgi:T5SS/PEP-CTERM-associated repeat protein